MSEYFDIISNIVTFCVGGGLVSLLTLRSTHKKAAEEANAVEATNMQTILETNQKYIVEPLTAKIDELEVTVKCLTCAINKINSCPHSSGCPVRLELQKHQADRDGD